jgi:hypothetical protein
MAFSGRQGERKSTASTGKQKMAATKATKSWAPWALGKAGRRLLESKNLPKEGLDVILVR